MVIPLGSAGCRCVLACAGRLSEEIDTTAGVTWSAIATNALLASMIGAVVAALGLLCAKPRRDRFSPPDAMMSPPRNAAITATPQRARDESEDMCLLPYPKGLVTNVRHRTPLSGCVRCPIQDSYFLSSTIS